MVRSDRSSSFGRVLIADLRDALSSFRDWRVLLVVLLYDWLFVLLLTALGWGASRLLFATASGMQGFASLPATQETLSSLWGFVGKSAALVIGFLVVAFFLYVASRAAIWLAVSGRVWSRRFWWRFVGVNSVWVFAWLVVWVFLLAGLRPSYAAVATVVLPVLYCLKTGVLHAVFARKDVGVAEVFANQVSLGLGRFHRFIFPLIVAVVVFFVWSQLWRFIPRPADPVFQAFELVLGVFIPFLAWWRVYVYRIIGRLSY